MHPATALAPARLTGEPTEAPPRRMGFATWATLTCPRGHRMREDAFAFSYVALRCKHREPSLGGRADRSGGGPECGALLFLIQHTGLLFAAEVTYADVRHMEREQMGLTDMVAYLGATFPAEERQRPR